MLQEIEEYHSPIQPLVHLVDPFQTPIESTGNNHLIICLKVPVSLIKMTCLHGHDVLHQSCIQGAGHIPHLDQLTDANRGSDSMHLLLCHPISQHKHVAREEGGGPHPDLPLMDGFLLKLRAVSVYALLIQVHHRLIFLLWLGLHHPPGLIAGHIRALDVDTLFPLEC